MHPNCKPWEWVGVEADCNRRLQKVDQHQQKAQLERLVDEAFEVDRAMRQQATTAEEALFARLAERLMNAMARAGLREAQKAIVVQEVVSAARELAADVQAGVDRQKTWERRVVSAARELAADVQAGVDRQKTWERSAVAGDFARHCTFWADEPGELGYDDEEEDDDEPELVAVDVRCACCQRDLGAHGVLVPEAEAAYIRQNTRCPGCIREGRELP